MCTLKLLPFSYSQVTVSKEGKSYYASLEINNVTVEDAGKYRVTAKNELGESNATISLNFDSKYINYVTLTRIFFMFIEYTIIVEVKKKMETEFRPSS